MNKNKLVSILNTLHNLKSYTEAIKQDRLDADTVKLWSDIKYMEVIEAIKILENEIKK